MKNFKNLFLVAMVVLLVSPIFVFADEEKEKLSYLEKAYFGGLYMGLMTKDYYNFQNDLLLLAAVKTKFSLFSGHVRSRLMYDFKEVGAHLWWEKNGFHVGYFPRPVALINRPEPVSANGNFEPPCKGVIPGPAFGVLSRINFSGIGNELLIGLYKTNKDSVELNYGIQQDVNWFIFKKVGVTGYYDTGENRDREHVNGVVFNAEFEKVSLMYFSGRDTDSVRTQSGFAYMGLAENAGLYVCLVYKQEKWDKAEIGIFKLLSEKIGNVETEYLVGLGYNYSENEPDTINFYLQIWLNK